jgi:hypothetical protein
MRAYFDVMQLPLRVTFRGTDQSPALEEHIRESAEKLAHVHRDITSCRVVVAAPAGHRRHGGSWSVRLDLSLPGREIVIAREPGLDPRHADPFVAVHDAFDAARRKLADERE